MAGRQPPRADSRDGANSFQASMQETAVLPGRADAESWNRRR